MVTRYDTMAECNICKSKPLRTDHEWLTIDIETEPKPEEHKKEKAYKYTTDWKIANEYVEGNRNIIDQEKDINKKIKLLHQIIKKATRQEIP